VTEVTVKFLGGMRDDMGVSRVTLSLPPGAALRDLGAHLCALGIDPEADDIIITLNSQGLRQWPAGRQFSSGDVIAIFPLISGG
jgi:molybdopterin converting factor small subunit